VVSEEAKYQLTNDGADKGNVGHVFECIRLDVDISILSPQRGVDGANDLNMLRNRHRGTVVELTLLM
jgi:hypothetical protein